jgi:acyl-CoA hydrolase
MFIYNLDALAGRIAYEYGHGPVVTLCFDRVDLLNPILHLDFVRLEGRLINVGKVVIISLGQQLKFVLRELIYGC